MDSAERDRLGAMWYELKDEHEAALNVKYEALMQEIFRQVLFDIVTLNFIAANEGCYSMIEAMATTPTEKAGVYRG